MLFVTFIIIIIYLIVKSFTQSNKLPFNIKRSLKVDINKSDKPIAELSFNGIPAIIYQSYNNKIISNDLIDTLTHNVDNTPEFDYYLLNNNDSRLFIQSNFEPKLLNVYDSLPAIEQNKLWIYCTLYLNGGIYIDINFKLKVPLINILTTIFSSLKSSDNIIFTKYNNKISSALIITPPHLPIFNELIDSYMNNNVVSLIDLINKYNYNNNIKLYMDNNYIKNIETHEKYISIN
jgi:mannosyltransferase OCH1-like enzyme